VAGEPARALWELREPCDHARNYLVRAVAELKIRKLIDYDPASEPWVEQVQADFADPSRDLLAGAQTIGELSDPDLWLLNTLVAARNEYAEYLMDQWEAVEPITFLAWAKMQEQKA
jgi:hypothetical protein